MFLVWRLRYPYIFFRSLSFEWCFMKCSRVWPYLIFSSSIVTEIVSSQGFICSSLNVYYIMASSWISQLVKNPPAMLETQFDSWVGEDLLDKDRLPTPVVLGSPCGSAGKESACSVGDLGSTPGLGRSPGDGKGYSLQVFWPGEFLQFLRANLAKFFSSEFPSVHSSVHSLSRVQLFVTLWTAARQFPVHHQSSESTQTHVHWVSDAIQPSHPLSSLSPPALNLSQHQGLFKWVSSSHQVARVSEFQLQHQSFQWTPRTDLL